MPVGGASRLLGAGESDAGRSRGRNSCACGLELVLASGSVVQGGSEKRGHGHPVRPTVGPESRVSPIPASLPTWLQGPPEVCHSPQITLWVSGLCRDSTAPSLGSVPLTPCWFQPPPAPASEPPVHAAALLPPPTPPSRQLPSLLHLSGHLCAPHLPSPASDPLQPTPRCHVSLRQIVTPLPSIHVEVSRTRAQDKWWVVATA